jgi:hypothetical protein
MNFVQRLLSLSLGLAVGLSAPLAFAQYYKYPYLEAECPNTASGSYSSRQTATAGFSGSGYLRSAGNTAAAQFNNTSTDRATYRFNTKVYNYYVLWLRVNTNNSANDDSWFHRIDGSSSWSTMNNIPAGAGWRWVRATDEFVLAPGEHSVELANREDGLNVDKLAIVESSAPAPTGAGGAAYNCAVPVYFETECRDTAFGQYQLDRKTKSGYSGSGYLESSNNSLNQVGSADTTTFQFETGAASYNLFFRIHNNQNAGSDSWFYKVDDGNWVAPNNTSTLGSGWRWAQGVSSVSLSRGVHTLEIRNREAGLSLDQLAFVPTTATGPSGTAAGSVGVNCEPFQTVSDWTQAEVGEYAETHLNYLATYDMLSEHHMWHHINGSGGMEGPGSGVAFMGFHRAMENDFKRFALQTSGRSWLPISLVGPVLPVGLPDAFEAMEFAGLLEDYHPREDTDVHDFGVPNYLTASGAGNINWSVSLELDGVTYSKLGDIPSLDVLGQLIGGEYHASLHNAIRGTMGNMYSPADPIFYAWHGWIDRIADQWLATPKGKAWATANQGHPFLVQGFTSMDGWNNADWAP